MCKHQTALSADRLSLISNYIQ